MTSTTARRRVLLAEDDEANRTMLRTYLEKRGYETIVVGNGLEVLEALDGNPPFDMLLLDWMMPVLSGIEALARLRNTHPGLPVIRLTALSSSTDVIGALELGADDFVSKPYDFNVLVARMEARMRRREKPDEPVPVNGNSEIGAGLVIDDRYELVELIGAGSFGIVYRAKHLGLETDVAVKILRGVTNGGTELISPIDSMGHVIGKARNNDAAEDFRKEGVRACRVQHPNAVRVFDYGELPMGLPYLVMELLTGRTVDDELRESKTLSISRAAQILIPVCDALATAHAERVIHRDIKPQNIFLHQANAGETVKVLDFGVAKIMDANSKATRDAIAGSPAYMAPERLRGRNYDGRSDVYAVGCTLYELLTGHPPFRSENPDVMAVALMQLRDQPVPPSQVVPGLPEGADKIVLNFLEKDPTNRPDAKGAIERLQDLLDVVA